MYFWYGNAAARTFGRAHRHRPYSFVWADCAWTVGGVWVDCVQMVILFVWKNIMGMGRGGACVPARVAPTRAHPSLNSPRTMRVFFLYGNAAARTFGRAHRHGPYGFVWADWTCVVLFVGKTVHMNQHHRCCTFVSPGLIEHSEIYPG